MKKWLQKSLMVSVAFLTFGMITPMHEIWDNFNNHKDTNEALPIQHYTEVAEAATLDVITDEQPIDVEQQLMDMAKEQSYVKFGTRIAPKIADDFDAYIFPKMQEAISMTCARLGDEALQNIVFTEQPSGGYAEKIFNISDAVTKKDIIRFHVRTENRPSDGFYYNFHYHTADDNFVTHYNLGDIYWSKNTPPKWLS